MLTKNAITYITDNEARDERYKESEALCNFSNQELDSSTVIQTTNITHKLIQDKINTLGEGSCVHAESSINEPIIDTNKIIFDD